MRSRFCIRLIEDTGSYRYGGTVYCRLFAFFASLAQKKKNIHQGDFLMWCLNGGAVAMPSTAIRWNVASQFAVWVNLGTGWLLYGAPKSLGPLLVGAGHELLNMVVNGP
jgi:hypothetical protein